MRFSRRGIHVGNEIATWRTLTRGVDYQVWPSPPSKLAHILTFRLDRVQGARSL